LTVVMVSNFLNHHQLMLCNELKENCDEFYFIATRPIPSDRLSLGYADMNCQYDFVIRTYDKSTPSKKIREILINADAVIFGACPDKYIELRMKEGKLSFLASERFFKKGAWRRFYPPLAKKIRNRTTRYAKDNYYILCLGAFLSRDVSLLGFPLDKCYKWGYFPEVDFSDGYESRDNNRLKILWTGRMLDWKRADTALKACRFLNKVGVDFQLDFIGEGEESDKLKALSEKYRLRDKVNFLGSMPPESVRKAMSKSDVFLFTSNFYEGWGAVLNEAMSSGCAVLASSAIGSVPYLVEDGKNGIVYKYGSQKDFNEKLLMLAKDGNLRKALGENAIKTIKDDYCPKLAAQRFMEFVKSDNKSSVKFESGPMSRAEIIKNKWYKK